MMCLQWARERFGFSMGYVGRGVGAGRGAMKHNRVDRMWEHVYVCSYIYIYIYMYVCMCVCVRARVYMYI